MTLSRGLLIWLGLVSLVAVFTAINIWTAIDHGALSIPPIYDDNTYLLDAYQRIAFEGVGGPGGVIFSFLENPPHAPLETMTAMVGFWIFGPYNFGPYVANAIALTMYGVGLWLIAKRNMDPLFGLLLVALMMFVPVAGAIITELRPDMAAGAAFALAAYWLINFRYDQREFLSAVFLALFVVLAISWKPSAFLITVPMLGIAGLMGLALVGKARIRDAFPAAIIVCLTVVIVLAPLVYVWGSQTYAYVKAAIVTNADIWNTPGSMLFHWTYNFMGAASKLGLGIFAPIGLLIILADISLTVWRGEAFKSGLSAIAYYIWCVIIYIGTALTAFKSLYQSSFFFFPFIVAMTIAISRGIGTRDKRISALASAVFLLFAIIFLPAGTSYQDGRQRPETNEMLTQITELVTDGIAKGALCGNALPIFNAVSPYPITPEAVLIDQAQKNQVKMEFRYSYFSRSLDEAMQIINASNYVLIPNQAGLKEGTDQNLPGVKYNDSIYRTLQGDKRWTEHRINAADPPILFVRNAC
ncbi:glycosyltransferase family 39 protein [Rhizobium sp. BK251]|uniref:glycosyltransferase family 39 protein n=1 Tax=Rhizobium sp. BK251 TaxID=2512125 RepID=UPI00104EC9FF|nr:glycosyltransferase family 39 protein [Rhizobium sp. BK251]TCL70393.1 dolichyl-phosphate-mannose-protein mannosyltransferase [Rhizobium sp. BK251]